MLRTPQRETPRWGNQRGVEDSVRPIAPSGREHKWTKLSTRLEGNAPPERAQGIYVPTPCGPEKPLN